MSTGDGGHCLLFMFPEKTLAVSLLLKYILHSALVKRTIGRTVLFPAIAESGGGGDEKLRVVILVLWESSSQLGTIVSLSICPLGAHSMV